jgi:Tfp pilus assembly protein PilV
MRTFFSQSRLAGRTPAGRSPRPQGSSQDGFLLIEVMISALLVALIVIATFTGFEAANHVSNIERLRDEATVLAAQSQDQMRSAPASALEALAVVPHSYTREVGKYVYTISQQARFVGGSESANGCSVTEQKTQVTNALRITSTVTWPHASQPVVESTVITPPTGSALEVDVGNGPAPTAGVAGVNVIVKYTAAGSAAVSTLEATTEAAGCVVFGAIPSTLAIVEIPELTGFVIADGAQQWPTKEVTLAPNLTTHYPVTYDRGGAITARFRYNGSNSYSHVNNNKEVISEPVTGDTFVAFSAGMELAPDFEVGSTRGEVNGLGLYQPKTGSPPRLGYEETATSPESTKYPAGNLFPFPETEGNGKWQVYAGDCKANNPEGLPTPIAAPTTYVQPAQPVEVPVPTSRIALNVYKGFEKEVAKLGAEAVKNLETTEAQWITITNTECASTTPDNETIVSTKHTQYTTTEATRSHYGGHLEAPFQPFGAYQLCLYSKEKKKTYTVTGADNTVEGTAQNIYLAQLSIQEREELKKAEETKEAEAKAKRIAEEAPAKTKREKEETTEREAREKYEAAQKKWELEEATQKSTREKEEKEKAERIAKEKTEKEKWEAEEKSKKISKATREKEEKKQKENREAKEKVEKAAKEKREAEEAATKATRIKEEATKPAREKEEKTTKENREKEEVTRAARETEETAKKNARLTRETEETKEGAAITVESGKAGCP